VIFYCGTYTLSETTPNELSTPAIPFYELDEKTGKIEKLGQLKSRPNPSFLTYSKKTGILLAVSEVAEEENGTGYLMTYRIGNGSGQPEPTYLSEPSQGAHPCHVLVDPKSKYAFVSNYNGGSLSMHLIDSQGKTQLCDLKKHTGSSSHPDRQTQAHAHCSLVDPSGEFLFVADLGIDQVLIYRIDREKHSLTLHSQSGLELPKGSGPRHLAYHEQSSTLYVLNELANNIASFSLTYPYKQYNRIDIIPSTPSPNKEGYCAAEITIHPNGKWLYCSNRGHNSLSHFLIDQTSGKLTFADHYPSGETPRHFAIAPSGNWLVCAHQDEGTMQVWQIDPHDGSLIPQGETIQEPRVVCICFAS